MVRLAAVTFALHQVINTVSEEGNQEHPVWSFAILCEFVQRAIVLMNFCIDQKFALGKPPFQPTEVHREEDKECFGIDEHRVKRLLELASPITVTKISQSHIQKRVEKKCRKEEAEVLMEEVVSINLGDIVVEDYQAGKQRRAKKTLAKRKIDELTEENKQLLKKLKVDMDKYIQ